jgi:hypothetical protein
VLRDVPRPELNTVASGIMEVRREAAPISVLAVIPDEYLDVVAPDPLDGCVEALGGQMEDVMDVYSALASAQTDHRLPKTYTCPVPGHEPNSLSLGWVLLGPPLDDWESEDFRIELLGYGEIRNLER